MERQNVTLSVSKEILLKAKLLAVRRRTSVSGLLTHALEQLVEEDESYSLAQRRHLAFIADPPDLGTGGTLGVERDQLHDRHRQTPIR